MNEELPKEVSKEDFSGNLISNNISKMTDGLVDSKEDRLEEIFDLRAKLDLSLKKIVNIKDKLQAYDGMVSKQNCEGVVASKNPPFSFKCLSKILNEWGPLV